MKIDFNLNIALSAFVPMKMIELLQRYDRDEIELMVELYRDKWTEDIASRGDIIQFHGGKPSEVNEVFMSVVNSLACMCILKGRIEAFDMIFVAPQGIKKLGDC